MPAFPRSAPLTPWHRFVVVACALVLVGVLGGASHLDAPVASGAVVPQALSSWQETHVIAAPQSAQDVWFGKPVAASGHTIAAVAFTKVGTREWERRVYVMHRTPATGRWQTASEFVSPSTNVVYRDYGLPSIGAGGGIALDRDTLVVGNTDADYAGAPEAVDLYVRGANGVFGLAQTVSSPAPNESEQFGIAVDLEGDLLAVGAPDWSDASTGGSVYPCTRGAGGAGS